MGLLLVMVARVFSEEASGKIICTRAGENFVLELFDENEILVPCIKKFKEAVHISKRLKRESNKRFSQ